MDDITTAELVNSNYYLNNLQESAFYPIYPASKPNNRLTALKKERFLTKRLFRKMSENMHYEIFKNMNSEELIVIREINLGGYQLISNPILRSRIKNYFVRDYRLYFFQQINVDYYCQKIELMYEQTGNEELYLANMGIDDIQCPQLVMILKYIPQIKSLQLSNK